MPVTFNLIRYKLRLIAGVVTALLAIGGGVGALAAYTSSPYALASHAYVDDKVDSALRITTASIGNLQRESAETRLQINQVRRDILRNDKSNRELQLKTTPEGSIRRLLQQRIEEIDDALRDVNAERDHLKAFSTP